LIIIKRRILFYARTILFSYLLLCLASLPAYSRSVVNSNADFNEEQFLTDILWNKFTDLPAEKRPKIALVLGGGGARGFAHIGVLQIMESAGVPIDLVVGTSMGSIVGAFYCAGIPMSKTAKLSENIKWGSISNLNVPSLFTMFLSEKLLSNEAIEKFLNDNIGALSFDDLKIPLVCVATDLNTGERILLREGSVSFAARASATIPGIFQPAQYNQRYLVDGGLYENLPVNVARIFNPDIIIAISVSADISKNATSNVFAILMQAIYIQGKVFDGVNMENSDIVISPAVGEISAIELDKAAQIIDKGFIAGQKSINNVKTVLINKTQGKYLFE